MRHKAVRLILGAVWAVSSVVLFARGDLWQGGLFLLVGAAFFYAGVKIGRDGKE